MLGICSCEPMMFSSQAMRDDMLAPVPRPISPMANLMPSDEVYLSWSAFMLAAPLAKSKPDVSLGYQSAPTRSTVEASSGKNSSSAGGREVDRGQCGCRGASRLLSGCQRSPLSRADISATRECHKKRELEGRTLIKRGDVGRVPHLDLGRDRAARLGNDVPALLKVVDVALVGPVLLVVAVARCASAEARHEEGRRTSRNSLDLVGEAEPDLETGVGVLLHDLRVVALDRVSS